METKLLPIISAALGFFFAIILFYIKEITDRKSKITEARLFIIFFIKTITSSINRRTRPTSASGFDEAIKKLAAARLLYYEWEEIFELNEINSVWLSGGYIECNDLAIPLKNLASLAEKLDERFKKA